MNKTRRLQVRLTEAEYAALAAYAGRESRNISDMARQILLHSWPYPVARKAAEAKTALEIAASKRRIAESKARRAKIEARG